VRDRPPKTQTSGGYPASASSPSASRALSGDVVRIDAVGEFFCGREFVVVLGEGEQADGVGTALDAGAVLGDEADEPAGLVDVAVGQGEDGGEQCPGDAGQGSPGNMAT